MTNGIPPPPKEVVVSCLMMDERRDRGRLKKRTERDSPPGVRDSPQSERISL